VWFVRNHATRYRGIDGILRPTSAATTLVAERLSAILVVAEVLARADAACCGFVSGLREALERPHDAGKIWIRQGEVQAVGAEEIVQDGGGRLADLREPWPRAPGRGSEVPELSGETKVIPGGIEPVSTSTRPDLMNY
jgi:hypothetical protein